MIISYLKYRFHAQGKYHLHSPMVFDLYENILEPSCRDALHAFMNDDIFYDDLDKRLKSFVKDNPLIFKEDDVVMIVKDIHRDKRNERDWDKLRSEEKVRLSIDCWRFGLVFIMDRLKKEHYILKV